VERGVRDADIDALEAFAAGHTGKGVVIALIGLGLTYKGSTLEQSLWRNPGEVPDNGLDDDRNGLVDDVVGYDFGDGDGDPTSGRGHDFKVAEIALAPHDAHTIAGVASEARLMVLKVSDEQGRVLIAPLPNALAYAAQNGAGVILLPWTFGNAKCNTPLVAPLSLLIHEISKRALVIGGQPGDWPACVPDVVSVQATGPDDRPSRPASPDIDLAAPGSDGRSPVGTSYAIGLVGGAAALVLAASPRSTPQEVLERLERTADKVHTFLGPYVFGRNPLFGGGRINLSRALGTDFDGDGLLDADDPDADGDGLLDREDPCSLNPDPGCTASEPALVSPTPPTSSP
jgi:subtilisin family serine protease